MLIELMPNSLGIVFLSSIFSSSETFKLIPEIAILMQCPFIVSLNEFIKYWIEQNTLYLR